MEMNEKKKPVLEVKDLSVSFNMYRRGLKQVRLDVIKKMNISLHEGEMLAIVGASGSGKSILAHAALGLLPKNAVVGGEILLNGEVLDKKLRRKKPGKDLIMIPQSLTYLDPLMKVGKQVRGVRGSREKQEEVFERYGLNPETANLYPFELSGGMARRILIATAVTSDAGVILADEPTPGLSEDLARETMDNFKALTEEGRAILMITHDIDLAAKYADTIAVFYEGEIVDILSSEDFAKGRDHIKHPYTRALWEALPQNGFADAYHKVFGTERQAKQDVLIECKDVSFGYVKGKNILSGLNFKIGRGEVVGLVGPSGLGKSTLAKIISGYERPDEGEVTWKGGKLPLKGYCPIQMIYQHPEKALDPGMKISDSLAEGYMPDDSLLEKLYIKKELWFDRWPNELSGGELQRFCVARVLGPRTELIIADEMSTMLDAITQAQIWKVLMEEVKRRNLGLLVITHNMALADKLCDRIVDLEKLTCVA